jgi:ATP-binding cassette, subfamily B, bacterial MsbA
MNTDKNFTTLERLSRLKRYFNKPIKYWFSAVFFTIVVALTEPLIPALMQPLLDNGFKQNTFPVWLVPIIVISIFAIRGTSVFLSLVSLAKVASIGIVKIRREMFAKLLHANLNLFKEESSSSLTNTVVYEVQNGAMLLVQSVLTTARDTLTLVALVGYLCYLNWKLTLLILLVFPVVMFIMKKLTARLYSIVKKSQKATDAMAYVIEENVMAHRDIRLYNAQAKESARFEKTGEIITRLFMKSTAAAAAMTPLTQMAAAIALSAVLSVALLQSAHNATTVGSFAAFITAMLMVIAPVKHLAEVSNQVTRGLASVERGILLIEQIDDEVGGDYKKDRADGFIDFHNIGVRYPESESWAIHHLDLSIQPGETVALVGTSGSGKTTLVNLLPRFIESTEGEVLLDGVVLSNWDLKSLRKQFAMVSQHVSLLNDTVAMNVCFGSSIDEGRVLDCLKDANLLNHIASLPAGIHTMVGHNAMQISGGQRQRLAIARALYKDAPILILDEATSALDTESERAIQEAFERLMRLRTCIVIAHRLSTVQHANRIVVMHLGKIVEIGSHDQLIKQQGQYAKLYAMGLG